MCLSEDSMVSREGNLQTLSLGFTWFHLVKSSSLWSSVFFFRNSSVQRQLPEIDVTTPTNLNHRTVPAIIDAVQTRHFITSPNSKSYYHNAINLGDNQW